MTQNHPITASGSIDMLGDEFPSQFCNPGPTARSPLAADIPGADVSTWSSEPRPHTTAWQGADLDAYWFNGTVWLHCQTGKVWPGSNITAEEIYQIASRAFAEAMAPAMQAAE